jgi:uncharacterized protein YkwD
MTVRFRPAAISGLLHPRRIARGLVGATACVVSLAAGAPHASAAPFNVDISKREDSRVFYNTVYAASSGVAIDWTGSIANCDAGSVSTNYLSAVLQRINYFRSLAGVPADITFTDANNHLAQATALLMSANKKLDHAPTTTWQCYSADAASGASSSNLALGNTGPEAIDSLIRDGGELGHRRWLLYPQELTMGSGDVPSTAQGDFPAASANLVFGDRRPERPAVRDQFVAWPPKGFIPYTLVPPRWSLSLDGADFTSATVTVSRAATSIPVAIQTRAGAGGFGEAAIIWVVNNLGDGDTWKKPDADEVYDVSVANVLVNGAMQTFNYSISVFDPATPGADSVPALITGADQVTPNVASTYSISSVPNATGYQWRSRKLTKLALVDGADNGLVNWTARVSATTPAVDTAFVGQPVFHLNASDFQDQSLTYLRTLQASSDSQVTFKSRQSFAQGSAARVEVSSDAGTSWTQLFEQDGVNADEPDFSVKTIDLSAFAGKPLLLRFSLRYISGESIFSGASDGWYFDDITFVDLREVAEPVLSAVIAGPTFDFTASEVAEYDLDARPQFFGQYTGDFAASKRVTSVAPVAPAAPIVPDAPAVPDAPIVADAPNTQP